MVAVAVFAGCAVGVAFVWLRALANPVALSTVDLAARGAQAFEFPRVLRANGLGEAQQELLGAAHAAVAALRSLPSVSSGRALCVAGVADDRGTAALASALAVAFAEQGERTLLCDPFGVARLDAARAPETKDRHDGNGAAWARAVRASATDGLWLLHGVSAWSFAGPARRRGEGALDAAAARFDRVVVLAPAALRSVDAQLCAKSCGAALLVGALGRMRLQDAEAVAAEFAAAGVGAVGFVLHGSRSRRAMRAAPMRGASGLRGDAASVAVGRDGIAPPARSGKEVEESA